VKRSVVSAEMKKSETEGQEGHCRYPGPIDSVRTLIYMIRLLTMPNPRPLTEKKTTIFIFKKRKITGEKQDSIPKLKLTLLYGEFGFLATIFKPFSDFLGKREVKVRDSMHRYWVSGSDVAAPMQILPPLGRELVGDSRGNWCSNPQSLQGPPVAPPAPTLGVMVVISKENGGGAPYLSM